MWQSAEDAIRAANRMLIVDGETDAVDTFFAAGYVGHLTEQEIRGHDAIRGVVEMYRRAFPDVQVEVEVLAVAGDRIAWQRTLRGTQQGAYRGFPASGRQIVWRDMAVSRLEDGLIAEEWVVTDLAERLLLARKR